MLVYIRVYDIFNNYMLLGNLFHYFVFFQFVYLQLLFYLSYPLHRSWIFRILLNLVL